MLSIYIKLLSSSVIIYALCAYLTAGLRGIILRKPLYLIINIMCVFFVESFLTIFIFNYHFTIIVTGILFMVLSLAFYYVHEFRGTNLNASDVLSIGTASQVATGYNYSIKLRFIPCIALLVLGIYYIVKNYDIAINNTNVILFHGEYNAVYDRYMRFPFVLMTVIISLVMFFMIREVVSYNEYDYSLFAGENEGYIYNFISSLPIFNAKTKTKINISKYNFPKRIIDKYTKNLDKFNPKEVLNESTNKKTRFAYSAKILPHVICIMNESFGSVKDRIHTSEKATPFYDSLKGVYKGKLYVNTFGGGTANTEFEFLTGMSVGDYPYPVMPYNNFVKSNKYSIAHYFKNLGYKTVAMHPYTATNYNRNKVYKHFGFEKLFFLKDFKKKKHVRKFVSDECMYDEVIKQFESHVKSKKRLFLFGVTVQNHSGYKKFNEQKIKLSPHTNYNINNKEKETIESYMSLMKISDDALKNLIKYFKKRTERVIILFFGDHNPSFSTNANKIFYDKTTKYEMTNAYEVPYFIFDNKHRTTKNAETTSANFLSLELFLKAGLPLDPVHKVLKDMYDDFPIFNYHRMKYEKNDVKIKIFDSEYKRLIDEYLGENKDIE